MLELAKNSDRRKVSSFLVKGLSRFSRRKLEELEGMVDVDLGKDPSDLSWDGAESIVSAFDRMDFITPSSRGLKPIGERNIQKGLEQTLDPDFVGASTRSP